MEEFSIPRELRMAQHTDGVDIEQSAHWRLKIFCGKDGRGSGRAKSGGTEHSELPEQPDTDASVERQ